MAFSIVEKEKKILFTEKKSDLCFEKKEENQNL